MSSPRRLHGQQGASLILALVFLTLFSVLTVSTLSLAGVSFRNTDVTRTRVDLLYAADGGIEYGIEMLAAGDPPLCQESSDTPELVGTIQINGATVAVECRTTEDEAQVVSAPYALLNGYTVIVTGANANGYGIDIRGNTNSGAPPSQLVGEVHSAGPINAPGAAPLTVDGNLELGPPQTCPPLPENVFLTGDHTCSGNQPLPDVEAPLVVVPDGAAPAPQSHGSNCTILYPGRYTSAPSFQNGRNYYLASGTYYFLNTGEIGIRGRVFGGAPGSDTQLTTSASPCATDSDAEARLPNQYDASTAGSGVTMIMGGNSGVRAQPNADVLELYTRIPAAGSPDEDATPGVTFWARSDTQGVHPSGAAYAPVPAGHVPLRTQNKASVVVLHGVTYLPQSGVVLREPMNEDAQNTGLFRGGIIARYLEFEFQGNSAAPPLATIAGGGGGATTTVTVPTTTVLVARAPGTNGTLDTVVTAVIDRPTSNVESWRKI